MSDLDYTKKRKPRNAGMFKPGVSGNHAACPKKDYRMSQLAEAYSPRAIMTLFAIAIDPLLHIA